MPWRTFMSIEQNHNELDRNLNIPIAGKALKVYVLLCWKYTGG